MKSRCRIFRWAVIAIVVLSFSPVANGQTPATSPVASASSAKTAAGQVANETKEAKPASSPSAARIVRIRNGDDLSVTVDDLKERLEKQPAALKTIRLFLDCKFVEGVAPIPCLAEKKVVFQLNQNAIEKITTKTKIVSVGISFTDSQNAELVMPEKVQLVLVARDYRLWLVIGIVLLMAIVLGIYGRYTNLLRDGHPPASPGTTPVAAPVSGMGGQTFRILQFLPGFSPVMHKPSELAQYSLAKVQMAWWLFSIVAAFLFIWLAVGDFNTVTSSTLILFGISVGTAVSSKMVDAGKQSNVQDLKATQAALEQQTAQLRAISSLTDVQKQEVNSKTVQLEQVKTQLSSLTTKPEDATSKGFLTDIMSDENGVSIHRFQMVVWTVVLTLIFAHEVYQNLSMPQFSDTLLTLMGISSGTYVTLKVPEKHSVVSN